MKKLLLGSAAVLAFSGGSAGAADLGPGPVAIPVAPPPVAFSWSGCYIGGHAGAAWERNRLRSSATGPTLPTTTTVSFSSYTAGGNTAVKQQMFNANGVLVNTGAFDKSLSGPIAGGQIGCNLQVSGGVVLGIEGDASWAGLSGANSGSSTQSRRVTAFGVPTITATGLGAFTPTTVASNGTVTTTASGMLHVKTDFLATVTGRVGYSWGHLLLYAKGGAAFSHDKFHLATTVTQTLATDVGCLTGGCTITNVQAFDFSSNHSRTGWTVGIGLEYAIAPDWSVRAEWNYMDFGTKTMRFADAFGAGAFDVTSHETVNAVKVGVNYLLNFGVPPGPLLARY